MRYRTLIFGGLFLMASMSAVKNSQVHAQAGEPKIFDTPELAISALIVAAKNKNAESMLEVLGTETREWITSGDPVQDRRDLETFLSAYDQKNSIEMVSDIKAILSIGNDEFPFLFPVVKNSKGWAFDPEQGKEELLDRRIGANELTTIEVLKAIGDAQRDYASEDRDGDGILEYASKFRSSDGKRDGLYWPTADNEELSPLGPLIAQAVRQGYTGNNARENDQATPAFNGYHFKMLDRQGTDAQGGMTNYVHGGNKIGGFAVVAFPAKYAVSGVMTFKISQDGEVYESNLGRETEKKVGALEEFNPGSDWKKVVAE